MALNERTVSDCAVLTHLLKAALGTGILSMPKAFEASGLVLGIFSTIVVSVICTHCAYILVASAHEIYERTEQTQLSYPEVMEAACLVGPPWANKMSVCARKSLVVALFTSYYMLSSCYTVIMAESFNHAVNHYMGYRVDVRITISVLLVPLVLLAYVPNLKYLTPFSMVANIFMGVGLCITMYYLCVDMASISERRLITTDITTFPVSVSITIFALQAIGVIMPLENNMRTPEHFVGLFGVLNQGMSAVTVVYIIVGFCGYMKYGDDVEGSITISLPIEEYAAQAVNILIGAAVFFTFGLQFYVCLDIAWSFVKSRYPERGIMTQYLMRTVMVLVCVSIAIAVPKIVPFVSLVGAFFFAIIGLMAPIVIEVLTYWEKGFGRFYWKIFKNIIVFLTSLVAMIFGSKSAVEDIINIYSNDNTADNSTSS